MVNLTLVAGYGAKPRAFDELVRDLQARLAKMLGAGFAPYSVAQVHGTIIGLEGRREAEGVVNANFLHLRGERRVMDLARAVAVLNESALPLRIAIGGFGASTDFGFRSRGRHPYERSFSLQGGIATVIGWPAQSDVRVRVLDDLRRRFAEANVLHKYHATDFDVDDDFYFVLGRVDARAVDASALGNTEAAMREQLAASEPIIVELGPQDLAVVAYEDPTLAPKSSRAFPLSRALGQLDEMLAVD